MPLVYSLENGSTTSFSEGYNAFSFTGKEKDSESGYYDFGARYYLPTLSTWLSVDPMADKYPSLSPYNYCAWNPMRIVDPDGMEFGDFIDENGKVIGNDGKKDGYVYVVRNGKDAPILPKDIRKAKRQVIKNSGNETFFNENPDIYDNFIQILPVELLKEAYNTIQDDGTGGSIAANNREYGGYANANGTAWEVMNIVSEIGNPKEQDCLQICGLMYDRIKFHSHASGEIQEGGTNGSEIGTYTFSQRTIHSYSWNQYPSAADINRAANQTNYVFGMGNGTLSVYNRHGIQATIPLKGLFGL